MTAPTSPRPVILWFRQDLRLADHRALAAAIASGAPVLPVYVLDDATPGRWAMGGASRWWLHESLAAIGRALAGRGAPLILRRGDARVEVPRLVAESGATALFASRLYEPFHAARDAEIGRKLATGNVAFRLFPGALLHEPEAIRTQSGGSYGVYMPFARACMAAPAPPAPLPAPARIPALPADRLPHSDVLAEWRLQPSAPDWSGGLRVSWQPGEAGAAARLAEFLDGALAAYDRARDLPGSAGTSRLSPHLHFGEISPGAVWHAAQAAIARSGAERAGEVFLKELLWREFSAHLLVHRPEMPEAPLRVEFARFPWADDKAALRAWQRGRTGYPIVDAGMRELWTTGWMHNRVRMIVASFLVKHLLIPWQAGEAWFWDTLVDADLASNAASWQWVAGSGADAAPYFRIFNPILQGEKFDPDGAYVRRFVPALARLPAGLVHKPWTAPPLVLAEAGLRLGRDYPAPIVEHGGARARALAAFARIGKGA
ncbi:MAG: deoxyribodipyrimidine photo-lyase [Alphaproteobacteria bacterium]|nr:deoxyribodipyrimidine photo-lyase [Alphaproteobacteria bacterium]